MPKISQSFAMADAVTILSPVTIMTLTPAEWHFLTASVTPFLNESLIPTQAIKTKSVWSSSAPDGFLIFSAFLNSSCPISL